MKVISVCTQGGQHCLAHEVKGGSRLRVVVAVEAVHADHQRGINRLDVIPVGAEAINGAGVSAKSVSKGNIRPPLLDGRGLPGIYRCWRQLATYRRGSLKKKNVARFGQNLHGATGTNVRVFVARPERTRILYSLFALAGSDM